MICEMTQEDVKEVAKIESLLFPTPWQEKDFINELTMNPFAHYYVYKIDGKIIGFIGSWITGDQGEITNVAIHPDYQRHGYGQELLSYALNNEVKVWTLEVRASNEKAQSLYHKNGFRDAAIRKDYYYQQHEDAILMVREAVE